MKRSKKWLMLVALVIPGQVAFSCSGTAGRNFRDAAVDGTSDYIQATAFDLLTAFVFPGPAADAE